MASEHLLHSRLTCSPGVNTRILKSRHPLYAVPTTQQLISSSDDDNRTAALWADHRWNAEWLEDTTKLRTFIPDSHPPGMVLPRAAWVRLTHLRTGVGVSDPTYTNDYGPFCSL